MNCTHFLDEVEIYSEDMSIHYTEISHWDDTFIIVEVNIALCSHIQACPSKAVFISKIITTTNLTSSTHTP